MGILKWMRRRKRKSVRKNTPAYLQRLLDRTLIKELKNDPELARKLALKKAGHGDIVAADELSNDPVVKFHRKVGTLALERLKEEIEMAKATATLNVVKAKEVTVGLKISDLASVSLRAIVRDGHLSSGLTVHQRVIEEHPAELIKFIEAITKAIDETKPMGPGATF